MTGIRWLIVERRRRKSQKGRERKGEEDGAGENGNTRERMETELDCKGTKKEWLQEEWGSARNAKGRRKGNEVKVEKEGNI